MVGSIGEKVSTEAERKRLASMMTDIWRYGMLAEI